MNKHLQRALQRRLTAAEAAGDKEQAKAIRARMDDAEVEAVDADEVEDAEDYESAWNKDDLLAEVESRGLMVEGTGEGGRVLKADLIAALQKDDAK